MLMRFLAAVTGFAASCGGNGEVTPDAAPADAAPADGASACGRLDFGGVPVGSPPLPNCTACGCTGIGSFPLVDLAGDYQGFPGRLYCGGNVRPAAHDAAGLALARAVEPLDSTGAPDPGGSYVFISVGMSNTTQEFQEFLPLAIAEPGRDPRLVIVDGAQGGATATIWANPSSAPWGVADQRLASAGVTGAQVAVAWVKLANAQPMAQFPQDAADLADDILVTLQNLKSRYPNLRLAYLSSRIYAGYAAGLSTLNPEPYAYQSGLAVKKLILDQIDGEPALAFDPAAGTVRAPWIAWGPYLWADGTTARSDGLVWSCADLQADGTHPSTPGRQKVAQQLFDFVRDDSTAREWFLLNP